MSIQTNIQEVRQRIAAACGECGRDPKEITLVGASKMNDAAACREAIAAGIDVLGENRVQEMTEKLSQNAYDGAPLHFIGHLQRNKVKQVVGKVALIQSVGSLPLLEAVEIVQRVRHHMHLRVFPANHLPIEPNVISFLRGHFYIPFALRRGFVVMWLCSGRWQRVRRPPVYLTD